jgi:hypothetical protein
MVGRDCSLTRYQSVKHTSSPGAVGFEPVTICISAPMATTGPDATTGSVSPGTITLHTTSYNTNSFYLLLCKGTIWFTLEVLT